MATAVPHRKPFLFISSVVWGSVSVFKLYGTPHRVNVEKLTFYRVFYTGLKWKDLKAKSILSVIVHLVFLAMTKLWIKATLLVDFPPSFTVTVCCWYKISSSLMA